MKSRVTAAVAQLSADITNEDPGTPNHEARESWAEMALANSQGIAENAMWTVVMNPTINSAGEAATDNDILFATSVWINDNLPVPPA
jgi:hypothetical protein